VKHGFYTRLNAEKPHIYFHHLTARKLLVGSSSPASEGLQLYSKIQNLTIPNGTLYVMCLIEFPGLSLFFSGDDPNILKEEVMT
jgi:hypothetical protein